MSLVFNYAYCARYEEERWIVAYDNESTLKIDSLNGDICQYKGAIDDAVFIKNGNEMILINVILVGGESYIARLDSVSSVLNNRKVDIAKSNEYVRCLVVSRRMNVNPIICEFCDLFQGSSGPVIMKAEESFDRIDVVMFGEAIDLRKLKGGESMFGEYGDNEELIVNVAVDLKMGAVMYVYGSIYNEIERMKIISCVFERMREQKEQK
jgi:hypothetical protein